MVHVCHPELWVSWIWTGILGLSRIHVPAGKHLGFRVPMHFLHLGTVPLTWKPGSLDPAPAPDQSGHPVQSSEIFIMFMSLSGWTFTIRQSPTRIKSCWKTSGCNFNHQMFSSRHISEEDICKTILVSPLPLVAVSVPTPWNNVLHLTAKGCFQGSWLWKVWPSF